MSACMFLHSHLLLIIDLTRWKSFDSLTLIKGIILFHLCLTFIFFCLTSVNYSFCFDITVSVFLCLVYHLFYLWISPRGWLATCNFIGKMTKLSCLARFRNGNYRKFSFQLLLWSQVFETKLILPIFSNIILWALQKAISYKIHSTDFFFFAWGLLWFQACSFIFFLSVKNSMSLQILDQSF